MPRIHRDRDRHRASRSPHLERSTNRVTCYLHVTGFESIYRPMDLQITIRTDIRIMQPQTVQNLLSAILKTHESKREDQWCHTHTQSPTPRFQILYKTIPAIRNPIDIHAQAGRTTDTLVVMRRLQEIAISASASSCS